MYWPRKELGSLLQYREWYDLVLHIYCPLKWYKSTNSIILLLVSSHHIKVRSVDNFSTIEETYKNVIKEVDSKKDWSFILQLDGQSNML